MGAEQCKLGRGVHSRDRERQEAVVRNSAQDWTLVRPPHPKDGAHTGVYQHGLTLTYGKP
jgi:hypothetical protein